MFPDNRQDKLNPILNALSGSPGVVSVAQDDFCSISIVVFLNLDAETIMGSSLSQRAGLCRPKAFTVPLRSAKAGVKRVFREAKIDFTFFHWPMKQYVADGCGGKRPDGYDCDFIKIEVFV